jgi:hypothetical protein
MLLCLVSLCFVSHFLNCDAECHFDECHLVEGHILFTVMLSVITPSVIMTSVVMLIVLGPLSLFASLLWEMTEREKELL